MEGWKSGDGPQRARPQRRKAEGSKCTHGVLFGKGKLFSGDINKDTMQVKLQGTEFVMKCTVKTGIDFTSHWWRCPRGQGAASITAKSRCAPV